LIKAWEKSQKKKKERERSPGKTSSHCNALAKKKGGGKGAVLIKKRGKVSKGTSSIANPIKRREKTTISSTTKTRRDGIKTRAATKIGKQEYYFKSGKEGP